MNEPNLNEMVENQLRSWTPHGPSPALERRLFGGAVAGRREVVPPAWHWLAPALGCCVAMMVLMQDHRLSQAAGGWGTGPESLWRGPYPSGQFRQINLEHNLFAVFRAPSLGWTNGGDSPSTTGSFSLLQTNGF